jgi:hypothetical protein
MPHHIPEDGTLGTYFDRLVRITATLESQMNISISIYLSMVLQPFVGPWPLFQFLDLLQFVGLLGQGDQPITRPLPAHRTAQKQNKCK